jgi:hypothetical protein
MYSKEQNKHIVDVLSNLKTRLKENVGATNAPEVTTPVTPAENAPKQPKKVTKVIFDKSSNPFEVLFSERGFLIDGTRMSFEEIETAISKEYNIVLKSGSGLVLDAIKMQKILKYKDLY